MLQRRLVDFLLLKMLKLSICRYCNHKIAFRHARLSYVDEQNKINNINHVKLHRTREVLT